MSDAYLRRTDKNKRSVITHHFVWDLDLFVASQQKDQRDLAAKGKDSDTITIATREEYRAFAWPKKST